jgi:hypothetical protein
LSLRADFFENKSKATFGEYKFSQNKRFSVCRNGICAIILNFARNVIKTFRYMKNLIIGAAVLLIFSAMTSCYHAPRQSWTPKYNKSQLVKSKPKTGKEGKGLHTVKMWR